MTHDRPGEVDVILGPIEEIPMNKILTTCALLLGPIATKSGLDQKGEAVDRRQPLLEYSIVGSSSCGTRPCYREVMNSIPVQAFLLDLAKGPAKLHAADAALQDTSVSVADLLTLRLIRREGDQYFLNFALFTAADVTRIRETSERYADGLAATFLARRKEIETVLGSYDAPGVDSKAVAYFLLGCASLDWDGLNLTAEKGYRKSTEERPDGNYVPVAQEIANASLERIYWGSHNLTLNGITFTSFGDHHSLPRYMFPDLLWQTPSYSSSYPDALKSALEQLLTESLNRDVHKMGRIMLALREGQKSSRDLARAANATMSKAKALLRVLVALDYVREDNGLYQAQIPVLTKRDEAMAREILAIGNQVMGQWLSQNYEKTKAELDDLSFTRSGVPFAEGYTMVWHYLFGITNRKLVEAGMFADPYAITRRYKGAIAAVYDMALP